MAIQGNRPIAMIENHLQKKTIPGNKHFTKIEGRQQKKEA